MKLNLNFKIKDISGKEIENIKYENMAQLLAESIYSEKSISGISCLDCFEIARSLHKDGEVEINKDKLNKIKDYVENSPNISILIKGLLIEAFIDVLNSEK